MSHKILVFRICLRYECSKDNNNLKTNFPFRNTPITVGQLDREGANATPSANLDGSYLQGGGIVSKPHQPPPTSRTTSTSLPPNDAAEDDNLDITTSKDAMADDRSGH